MSDQAVDRLRALYPQAWERVRRIPGVSGLGIGVVENPRSGVGWRVYVDAREDRPAVPAVLAGHPAVVVPQSAAFLCYGNDFQATLRPGIEIASKGIEPGSLGCFARLKSDPSRIVILSNSHVLYGDVASMGGSGDGAAVGQPSVSCCCCCKCRVVAVNRANVFSLARVRVTHPSLPGPQIEEGSEIDAAIAVLKDARPYTNDSAFYGMIAGTPASGLGVVGGDPVEMIGSTSGHQKGKILQFTTSATYLAGGSGTVPNVLLPFAVGGGSVDDSMAGAHRNINQLIVVPDPDPSDPTRRVSFVRRGDSGSVVVNAAKQVIGIVTRAFPTHDQEAVDFLNSISTTPIPPHAEVLGVVCPIGPALSLLNIEIVNGMSGTAPAAGEELLIPEAERIRQREEAFALQITLRDLDQEVRSRALGREIMELIDLHRPEIERLIDRRREVTVAWHRSQGPAYAAHLLNSIKDHDYRIPSEVRGVTPAQLVTRMAAVLRKHGSERLRDDVARYEPLALEWIDGRTSVWELVERMRRLEPGLPADRDDGRKIA